MAVRRSIHAKISLSESVEAMTEWAQLLWDRVFVHADDFGIIEASPSKIKAKCKPMSPRPLADFATAVVEMVAVGMMGLYEADGKVYARVLTFDAHQTVPKRTASKFPKEGAQLSTDEYLRKFTEIHRNSPLAHAGGNEKESEKETKRKNPSDSRPSSRRSARTFSEDSREVKAAKYLHQKLVANNAEARDPNWQSWAREFDLLFRIDKRSPDRVREVIDFSQTDPFWLRNVLSPAALRKQFDKLILAMTHGPPAKPTRTLFTPGHDNKPE